MIDKDPLDWLHRKKASVIWTVRCFNGKYSGYIVQWTARNGDLLETDCCRSPREAIKAAMESA